MIQKKLKCHTKEHELKISSFKKEHKLKIKLLNAKLKKVDKENW